MRKRILLISPVPSHPQNEGNRARIYNLLLNLKKIGQDVYFVHIKQEQGDEKLMRQCWGENYFSLPAKRPQPFVSNSLLIRFFENLMLKLRLPIGGNFLYNFSIDEWYDESVVDNLINISRKINPEAVIVEYVFFSKALECFGENTLKVLDTHDIFSNRYKVYLKNGQKPRWYSTTEKEENRGLNRADVVIAIHQKEADIFSKRLKSKKVVTVGHVVPLRQFSKRNICNKLLFIGSRNLINVHGINTFIKRVFPLIKARFNNAQLILAGDICNVIKSFDGCSKLGRVEKLEDAYDLADVVISPIPFGTGLKIKNIEALGYSKPLVTTPAGAEGLEKGAGRAFLVAKSPQEFACKIAKILLDADFFENLSRNAFDFARDWNQGYLKVLQEILEN